MDTTALATRGYLRTLSGGIAVGGPVPEIIGVTPVSPTMRGAADVTPGGPRISGARTATPSIHKGDRTPEPRTDSPSIIGGKEEKPGVK